MLTGPDHHRARPRVRGLVALVIVAVLAVACSRNDGGEPSPATSATEDPVAVAQARVDTATAGVTDAEGALISAHQDFCGTAKGYVEILDRYGRVFTDRSATVGDVQTAGADLVEPRDEVTASADSVKTANADLTAAQQELVDAQDQQNPLLPGRQAGLGLGLDHPPAAVGLAHGDHEIAEQQRLLALAQSPRRRVFRSAQLRRP